jgi:hypothetical protein
MTLSIEGSDDLARALRSDIDHRIKELLRLRARQLAKDAPDEDLADLAHFAVVQPGDTPADLEEAIGFSVFVNQADGSRPGDPNWTGPGCEWIEDHGWGVEAVWILDDSGFGHVVIIPKAEGVDPELLNLCRAYAHAHA